MELDRFKDIKIHGVAKFFHWVFMTLTYPLRHPFRFLVFLLAVALAFLAVPLSQHVPLKDTISWYFVHKQDVLVTPQPKRTLPQPKVLHQPTFDDDDSASEILPPPAPVEPEPKQYLPMKLPSKWLGKTEEIEPSEQAEPLSEELQTLPAPEVEVSAEAEQKVSAQSELPAEALQEPVAKLAYRKDENLPLVYEDQPKQINGKAMIFSPNEMTVGKTYLILYGIYTNPKKHNVKAAEKYLTELVRGKTLTCDLVAYTYQNLPTGVCYLDGQSLNQKLVDAGFADNVAL